MRQWGLTATLGWEDGTVWGTMRPACGFSVARAAEAEKSRESLPSLPEAHGCPPSTVTFSGSSDLLGEPSDDTAGGVVLVERMGQLLARGLQLLAQGEAVQHDGVLPGRGTVRRASRHAQPCYRPPLPALGRHSPTHPAAPSGWPGCSWQTAAWAGSGGRLPTGQHGRVSRVLRAPQPPRDRPSPPRPGPAARPRARTGRLGLPQPRGGPGPAARRYP